MILTRAISIACALAFLTGPVSAEDPQTKSADVNATIQRGLAFLAQDAVAWKTKHNCVSCHHAGMICWALHEGKQRGHTVDETVRADLTRSLAEAGDGKTSVPRPACAPRAINGKALWFALGLSAVPAADPVAPPGLKLLLKTVQEDQNDNGSWSAWPNTRPPLGGPSNDSTTALATLALLPLAAAGDETAKNARDKGMTWLATAKSDDDPQSLAMRLVLSKRLDRPAGEWQPLLQRIKERQNEDGGWSQAKDMASDAWATGQALYALAYAGSTAGDPVVDRAHAFLKTTQREDGSWPMTSRPIPPSGEGSKYLVPITGAGSSWAVLGLVRSGPNSKSRE